MAFIIKAAASPSTTTYQYQNKPFPSQNLSIGFFTNNKKNRKSSSSSLIAMSNTSVESVLPKTPPIPIMVNGCTGKMGTAVLKAAIPAGLEPVFIALGRAEDALYIDGIDIEVIGHYETDEREEMLTRMLKLYPDLIVVDYTVPAAVNDNAALYAKVGVPFVMGTTGGDRELLYKTVAESNIYALISPQMGKQVVAFLAAMEIMAEQFPGAFSGYNLTYMESQQASEQDLSGTAKALISCFQKLCGVSFDLEKVEKIRDPRFQVETLGIPQEHLRSHEFHTYFSLPPDGSGLSHIEHRVFGRSIYAEGTIDAVLFLAKKIKSKADKRIYDMIDVLREGNMR